MHRDDCLITTVEEATEWLDRYRHTVGMFDPQVLRVIECLEAGQSEALQEAESNLTDAESKVDRLEALQEVLLEAAEEWAGYVTADDAPRTLIDHLDKAIASHP